MIRALIAATLAIAFMQPAFADDDMQTSHRARKLSSPPMLQDLPMYGNVGKYVAVMEFSTGGRQPSYTITFLTTDDPGSVMQFYADTLRKSGWNHTSRDAIKVVSARKKRAAVTVAATASPDKKYKSSVYINYRNF